MKRKRRKMQKPLPLEYQVVRQYMKPVSLYSYKLISVYGDYRISMGCEQRFEAKELIEIVVDP